MFKTLNFGKKKENKKTESSEEKNAPAKVKEKNGKSCEKVLTVEVGKERIEKEYTEFYKAIASKAKVPGFRPGKVPHDVLVMNYKKDADQSVLERLIQESLTAELREKQIAPLTAPKVDVVKFSEEKLSFKAHIEVRPKVKLSKVVGLSAKKEKVKVKPEDIENALKQIQERHSQYSVIENRAAQLGDFVIADYVCEIDGKEVEKRSDDRIEIKEEEYLKGFSTQLIGVKSGDERDVKITFEKDMPNKEMAGKDATFKMKIKELKEKKLPALDDELAKQEGDFKNISVLREKLENDIKERLGKETESKFEKELLDELLKHNKLDVPEGLGQKRVEYLLEQTKQQFMYQPNAAEIFEKEKENFKKNLEPQAREQVQIAFLLDEIAVKENITVEDADVKSKYIEMSQKFHQPAETIEKYYTGNKEALDSLTEQIRSEKTVQFLKKNAKIKS